MTEVIFLDARTVKQLHKMQIENFGGTHGLRDEGMLDSALNRPINKSGYGSDDICDLAAAYLFRLARNHAFLDGNKRIAIVTAGIFLMENGFMIQSEEARLYQFVMAVASGEIDEDGVSRFLKDHIVPYP